MQFALTVPSANRRVKPVAMATAATTAILNPPVSNVDSLTPKTNIRTSTTALMHVAAIDAVIKCARIDLTIVLFIGALVVDRSTHDLH